MRYLIDTNIFVYMASDPEYLNRDIDAIIQEPETLLYISAESTLLSVVWLFLSLTGGTPHSVRR